MKSSEKNIEAAVLPLAGAGTRMFPSTTAIDKAMHPIYLNGRAVPLVDFMVREAVDAGVEHLVVVTTTRGQDQIQEYYGELNRELEAQLKRVGKDAVLEEELARRRRYGEIVLDYVIQESDKYGSAVPLHEARSALGDVQGFVLLGGDDFVHREDGTSELTHAIKTWRQSDATHAMMGSPVKRSEASRYGILQTDANGNLLRIDEKPPIESLPVDKDVFNMNISRYLLQGEVVWEMLDRELNDPNPDGGEYYMVNVINRMLQVGESVVVHTIGGQYLDGGTPQGILAASNYLSGLAQFRRS